MPEKVSIDVIPDIRDAVFDLVAQYARAKRFCRYADGSAFYPARLAPDTVAHDDSERHIVERIADRRKGCRCAVGPVGRRRPDSCMDAIRRHQLGCGAGRG